MGRPTDYTQDIASEICSRIIDGESLRKICSDDHMPSKATIFNWLAKNDSFLDQYTRAKSDQADTMEDDMLAISDSVGADAAEVAKARLQIETRKWIASKLKPKKYGDKLDLNHSGTIVSIKDFTGRGKQD